MDFRPLFFQLISDYIINAPLDTVLRFHADLTPKAYFYEFAYVSPNDTLSSPERGTLDLILSFL